MNITFLSLQHLSKSQREREAGFYSFIFERMIGPSPNNDIYYTRFLTHQFNTFPVGKGYPIIGKNCNHPSCYFYLSYDQAKDLEHNFFRFLNSELNSLKCKCGNSIREVRDFVYDSPLAGFLQLKLTEAQLSTVKEIQITKNHEVYIQSKGAFHQGFNKARLKAISALVPLLAKRQERQQSQGKESKTLKVNSYSIMHQIQSKISQSPFLAGKEQPHQNWMVEQDKLTAILPHFVIKQTKGSIYMYKQTREEQKFSSVPLQLEQKLDQKLLEYYDFSQFTYYYLSIKGDLFYCDLRYMYSFVSNAYQINKLCTLDSLNPIAKDYSSLLVRKRKLYLFSGKQGEQFVDLLRAELPEAPSEAKVQMKPILSGKVRNRRGYSVSWIKGNTLVQDQCIIIFGGILERVKNFKLLQIIALGTQERYIVYKVPVREEDFNEVSFCHPTITIFAGRLVVLGGLDLSQAQPKLNRNIAFLALKEENAKVEIKQVLGQDKKEETIERIPGGLHVGEGWMVVASKSNKRLYPLINRLRKMQNGDVEIQYLK